VIRARIAGLGAYAPTRVLTNQELEQRLGTSDEWITQRTGIRERRIADASEATSDLALPAARQALDDALPPGLDIIDCVDVPATMSASLADLIDASSWRLELPGVGDHELVAGLGPS